VIADNDPVEQEKIIKFNSLLANCVVFHTALDMTEVVRELIAEGWEVTAELLAQLSPYLTEHINRFGIYPTDDLAIKPAAFDPALAEIDFETLDKAA
jgi:Tn3 transposase DDE domain-containing protein